MNSKKIYAILKSVLADLTGKDKGDIFADDNLRNGLRFTSAGLFSLAVDLNEGFQLEGILINPTLHGDETMEAQTVRDLRILISKRF